MRSQELAESFEVVQGIGANRPGGPGVARVGSVLSPSRQSTDAEQDANACACEVVDQCVQPLNLCRVVLTRPRLKTRPPGGDADPTEHPSSRRLE